MVVGIDGSRAFLKKRTGIEEYSYQVIRHLAELEGDQARLASASGLDESRRVILYLRSGQTVDFKLPKNWSTKTIRLPRYWTQIGLSLEMLFNPVDVLFVPAHTVPFIHPENSVVTIHGLEYEFCPKAYSAWEKFYMKTSIRKSCQWAKKIIAVSENTKKDLINIYKVPQEKIQLIYEGISTSHSERNEDSRKIIASDNNEGSSRLAEASAKRVANAQDDRRPYIFFVGRLEERKNIIGIIDAFEILKEQYKVTHKLVLGGKPGYGYEKIRKRMEGTNCFKDIIELGYLSEDEKWKLMKSADVFVFPAFYEGFGLPVLEAQSLGVPVVASNCSSIPEIVSCHSDLPAGREESRKIIADGDSTGSFANAQDDNISALLVDPSNAEEIADAIYKIISDEKTKQDLIAKGLENAKRFDWSKCAREVAKFLKQ